MNFAIRFLTEYRYERPITDNLNALRVKPATMATQSVEDFVVRVDPESRLNQHLDYYGTTVIEFGISRPHEQLAIDVRARVVTAQPGEAPDPGWEDLEKPGYRSARSPPTWCSTTSWASPAARRRWTPCASSSR